MAEWNWLVRVARRLFSSDLALAYDWDLLGNLNSQLHDEIPDPASASFDRAHSHA
jgi:hypothetical protein